ncbi:hypothetical protein [Mycobacteroides abscessus]|uniref:hypothetical protein n=1 Tax=Mycobacteroides abscessus TaxID=36809 RepID=UPI0034E86272
MTTDTAPVPLPAGALLFGVSDTDGRHHIVARDSATHALDLWQIPGWYTQLRCAREP